MSAKFSPGSKEYERELGLFLFFEDDCRPSLTVFTEDVLAAALVASPTNRMTGLLFVSRGSLAMARTS